MGYTFEANPWTFKNTNTTLHNRLTKIEGEDSLTIDLLVGNEGRHKEIIENAIVEETEYGLTCIASREDLIWMKRFRNSKQDIADIEALENDKNTESSQRYREFAGFLQKNQVVEGPDKEEGLGT